MAGQISAAEGAIYKGADTVSTTREDLTSRISTVRSQIEAIGTNWQGSAAVAFQNLMQQWNQDATKVTNALIQFEENLRKTQDTFTSTDEDQQSIFVDIARRLG